MPEFSVIIPTYNRTKDLSECLNSTPFQTVKPSEIVLVDNSFNNESEELFQNRKQDFEKNGIALKYIKNQKENSLTVARNLGIKAAKGDVVLFLDDDVILDKNYIKEVLKVYEKYPEALGVQGYINQGRFSIMRNLVNKFFFLYHLEKEGCRALPSISATYPYKLNKIILCQWMSGANHSYKKEVFEEFQYDEKLKKYSEGEDLEMSHRVFKKYLNSLYITPYAELVHKTSPRGRELGEELITMREVYGLYTFYKVFNQSAIDKIIYLWSRFGKLVFNFSRSIFKLSSSGFTENIFIIKAYLYCLKNLKQIKNGDLEFFNKTLS